MKTFLSLFTFLLISSSLLATHDSRSLNPFNKLKVSEGISVELIKSNKNSADVHTQNGKEDDVITQVTDGVLKIYWKKGTGYDRSASVTLNYTNLESISTSSGAKVKSDGVLSNDNINLSASSGSNINLEIESNNVVADVSSGSRISLRGKTKKQEVNASSGSSYKADKLESKMTKANASSGSSITVNTSDTLNAEASSGASIKYKGNPTNKDFDASEMTGANISSFK